MTASKLKNKGRSKHDPKVTRKNIERRISRIDRRRTVKGLSGKGGCIEQLENKARSI